MARWSTLWDRRRKTPGCRDVVWYDGRQGLHELQSGVRHGWKQLLTGYCGPQWRERVIPLTSRQQSNGGEKQWPWLDNIVFFPFTVWRPNALISSSPWRHGINSASAAKLIGESTKNRSRPILQPFGSCLSILLCLMKCKSQIHHVSKNCASVILWITPWTETLSDFNNFWHATSRRNMHCFAHLTLILLLHYVVKCRSRSLDIYNNEFILGTACRFRKSLWDQKIIENMLLI